ncbi:hypothetical protein [Leptospira alexanderi]|uniref:hypothetical protein n=1 Tax=Leptospira alexanderi TaxID=100053 RepID=UPI0011159A6E|nr:hypothetical protein [Leptospira alexanderi]
MNTSKIEKTGIAIFESLLTNSEYLDSGINKDDRGPSWDGHLILYSKPNTNKKESITGKIPIQIKSTMRKAVVNESINIDRSDLNNYLNDGGIIFLRPIFENDKVYKIFYCLLLPINIQRYLKDVSPTKKKIKISLEEAENAKKIEFICRFFLDNHSEQKNLSNYIDINSIDPKEEIQIIAKTILKKDFRSSLYSPNTFFYAKLINGITVPIKNEFSSFTFSEVGEVLLDDEVYFKSYSVEFSNSTSNILKINNSLTITITENDVDVNFNSPPDLLFPEALDSLKFLKALSEAKKIKFGNSKITFNGILNFGIFQELMDLYDDTRDLLENLGINYDKVKIKELSDNIKTIYAMIFNMKNSDSLFFDSVHAAIFTKYTLLNSTFLFLFLRNQDGSYRSYNFMDRVIGFKDFVIPVNNQPVPCSRFLSIKDVELLSAINGHSDFVFEDLKTYFTFELIPEYQRFMLNLIFCFDAKENIELLNLATSINDLIFEESTQRPELIGNMIPSQINKFQIIKRQRELHREEIELLLKLKFENSNIPSIVNCVNILTDNPHELEFNLPNIPTEELSRIKDWPIWNLYLRNKNIK